MSADPESSIKLLLRRGRGRGWGVAYGGSGWRPWARPKAFNKVVIEAGAWPWAGRGQRRLRLAAVGVPRAFNKVVVEAEAWPGPWAGRGLRRLRRARAGAGGHDRFLPVLPAAAGRAPLPRPLRYRPRVLTAGGRHGSPRRGLWGPGAEGWPLPPPGSVPARLSGRGEGGGLAGRDAAPPRAAPALSLSPNQGCGPRRLRVVPPVRPHVAPPAFNFACSRQL